ncbi:DUF1801 domain-containing protein [Georgenia wangjunii]|uniref:DUF1801 domain-containing protein n=1 Tax=Georgenia wangjunii TaxID=3117730 RepID=UPI002F269FB4
MSTKDSGTDGGAGAFSAEERAAMKARAAELKKEVSGERRNKKAADELDVLTTIAEMAPADRALAERIHAIVIANAPDLSPKLWYGQPAYARKGKVVCFFRSGAADKERYSTFGFTNEANLDEAGGVWATSFAVADLSDGAASALGALVKRAVT